MASPFPMDAYIQARRYKYAQDSAQDPIVTAAAQGIATGIPAGIARHQSLQDTANTFVLKDAIEQKQLRQKYQADALQKLFTDPQYDIVDPQGVTVPIEKRINLIPVVLETGQMPAGYTPRVRKDPLVASQINKNNAEADKARRDPAEKPIPFSERTKVAKAKGILQNAQIVDAKGNITPLDTQEAAAEAVYALGVDIDQYPELQALLMKYPTADQAIQPKQAGYVETTVASVPVVGKLFGAKTQDQYNAEAHDATRKMIRGTTPPPQAAPIDKQISDALIARGIAATPENIAKAKLKLQNKK